MMLRHRVGDGCPVRKSLRSEHHEKLLLQPREEPRKQKPGQAIARSAGFAICSPRGMGDRNEDASGINASGRYNMNWVSATRQMVAGATRRVSPCRASSPSVSISIGDAAARRNPD